MPTTYNADSTAEVQIIVSAPFAGTGFWQEREVITDDKSGRTGVDLALDHLKYQLYFGYNMVSAANLNPWEIDADGDYAAMADTALGNLKSLALEKMPDGRLLVAYTDGTSINLGFYKSGAGSLSDVATITAGVLTDIRMDKRQKRLIMVIWDSSDSKWKV